jgi:hypothetical protein
VAAAIHEKRWVEEAGDLRVADACRVPAGTRHRYVIATDEEHKLVAVTRLLRRDLKECAPGHTHPTVSSTEICETFVNQAGTEISFLNIICDAD